MAAYISGAAYILVSYTIRIVLYGVVYAAVWVFIVGMVLDDRNEKFFKRQKQWLLSEEKDDTWVIKDDTDIAVPQQGTVQVNQ